MGQKVHPVGFRLGIVKDWDSKWYANKLEFADLLHEDLSIKKMIKQRFYQAGVSKIEIERAANRAKVTIHTGRPGMIIGRGGAEVDKLRKDLEQMTGRQIQVNIVEIKTPETDAQLVAESIAFALERRISFRRAMRQAQQRAIRQGAKGIKVAVSGRLGGAEIARTEWSPEGSVPLHTLRADIDYGFAEANTTFGKIGVKVWIYHGEVLPETAAQKKDKGGE
ncbi:MAG: 30S ribosomal protein S3 [Limnochordia bacterium]|mgnify:CR=1 FL=1|jgi:small subunit ribosomal protein S3|nr:30S ribosomal protein S3 [Limnochordia bacterium]MDI9465985.1 30S ribosomal protein S3 [Bacillota bacterium]NLO95585.1 30S ribosomal protein S3 [Bacillota bacterium]HAN95866.1 30S ribosomal protein S3 [Bacillota bacterium]HOB40598.1 30S ribosomal protein S3 [Limnochordia bacterium]